MTVELHRVDSGWAPLGETGVVQVMLRLPGSYSCCLLPFSLFLLSHLLIGRDAPGVSGGEYLAAAGN